MQIHWEAYSNGQCRGILNLERKYSRSHAFFSGILLNHRDILRTILGFDELGYLPARPFDDSGHFFLGNQQIIEPGSRVFLVTDSHFDLPGHATARLVASVVLEMLRPLGSIRIHRFGEDARLGRGKVFQFPENPIRSFDVRKQSKIIPEQQNGIEHA